MDKSIVLQILNGFISVFAACGTYIFVRYLYKHKKEGYTKRVQAGLAILCLCVGTVTLRGPVFIVRTLTNSGMHLPEPILIYIFGGILIGIAFLCVIRVFSPTEWGNKPWIIALISGTFIVTLSLLFVQLWSYQP